VLLFFGLHEKSVVIVCLYVQWNYFHCLPDGVLNVTVEDSTSQSYLQKKTYTGLYMFSAVS